jgi:8-oxo-dGTP pyrophosphatase MutT (NUDIX family)
VIDPLVSSIPLADFIPMIETSSEIQTAHPAATIVLVRDGEQGLEVLLVQRNQALKHMGGMWVFPGGRVDEEDRVTGGDDFQAALHAAVRETQEEAGLNIRIDQLVTMSHWTTPEGARRRFSTWFFLAALSDGQEVTVDGGEISHHQWCSPQEAFAAIADDDNPFKLTPPTFISLMDIADYRDCGEAEAALRPREPLIFAPRMVFVDGGICFLYAGDAGYETVDIDLAGSRHRTYMIDDQLEYVRSS